MATYYDALNYTFKLFEENPPPASAQLVFVHLLHQNNRLGNSGVVQISDRELGYKTRLSKQTITEAKRTLKNRGLIDFKTDRDKPHRATTYTLPFFKAGLEVGQLSGQGAGQTLGLKVGHTGGVCVTRNTRQDLKKEEQTRDVGGARAREILGKLEADADRDAAKAAEMARGCETCGKDADRGDEHAHKHAGTLPLVLPKNEEDIFKVWETEQMRTLNARQKYALLELTEDPDIGFEKVKKAIETAKDTSPLLNPTYEDFMKVLNGESLRPTPATKKATKKGEERNGGRFNYEEDDDPRAKWKFNP